MSVSVHPTFTLHIHRDGGNRDEDNYKFWLKKNENTNMAENKARWTDLQERGGEVAS